MVVFQRIGGWCEPRTGSFQDQSLPSWSAENLRVSRASRSSRVKVTGLLEPLSGVYTAQFEWYRG